MLDVPHPPVPPDLARAAAARGERLLLRRRRARRLFWSVLAAALAALALWAVAADALHRSPARPPAPAYHW